MVMVMGHTISQTELCYERGLGFAPMQHRKRVGLRASSVAGISQIPEKISSLPKLACSYFELSGSEVCQTHFVHCSVARIQTLHTFQQRPFLFCVFCAFAFVGRLYLSEREMWNGWVRWG